jgi:thiamine biosynthesis lipoprotein
VIVERQVWMDAVVSVRVEALRAVGGERTAAVAEVFSWFAAVERACSRFDPLSELSRICRDGDGIAGPVLAAALGFAVELASLTGGAFDPMVGSQLVRRGFDRHWRDGAKALDALPGAAGADDGGAAVGYDTEACRLRVAAGAVVDLGAVAKGLALDLGAQALGRLGGERFLVEAGGDLISGSIEGAGLWRVGVADPFRPGGLVATIEVRDGAVCTSGGYVRRRGGVDHLVRSAPLDCCPAGVTVLAPSAMAADGLATAAMVLAVEEAVDLLGCCEVDAIVVDASGGLRLVGDVADRLDVVSRSGSGVAG